MTTENPTTIFVVILVYIFGALAIALWGFVTTKIVVAIFPKEKIFLRIILWPILGWFLGITFYLVFLVSGGLISLAISELLKWNT